METSAFHAVVRGLVQGVSFRYYTRKFALDRGLTGWVRNRVDGSVEVWAEGPRSELEALIAWLNHGPSRARVDAVEMSSVSPLNERKTFDVTR